MAKLVFVTAVVSLFFSLGLFAGHRIPGTAPILFGSGQQPEYSKAADPTPDTRELNSSTTHPGDNRHFFVSSGSPVEALTNQDVGSDFGSEAGSLAPEYFVRSAQSDFGESLKNAAVDFTPQQDDSEAVPNRLSAPDHEKLSPGQGHRTEILKLIQRRFPGTEADVAEIWAETYAELDLDEVSFVLDQKYRISSELGAAVTDSSDKATTPISEPLDCTSCSSTTIAVETVQRNLSSAYSLGYCRMAVFPEVNSDPDKLTSENKCDLLSTSFRSFESGPTIPSPSPIHIALAKSDSTMFLLDDKRLTRRGDFRMLTNRRLGIVTPRGEMASAESTPFPQEAFDIRISPNGLIQFRNTAGELCEAGRIAVCTVPNFSELQSEDGVIFESLNYNQLEQHADAAGLLLPNTLELSNVDKTHENSLLTFLKSLTEVSY